MNPQQIQPPPPPSLTHAPIHLPMMSRCPALQSLVSLTWERKPRRTWDGWGIARSKYHSQNLKRPLQDRLELQDMAWLPP
jgi:hypothetical protein